MIDNDINETWSLDLAYVDKLARYNRGVQYLLVAVNFLSRFLRAEPLKTKYAKEITEVFQKMIKTKQAKKVWVDKGTEFKIEFEKLFTKRKIVKYNTNSEKKSAFAERIIRSLKNIIYKYLELEWTYSYIENLQSFVQTINSRIKSVTKLAPNKVTRKHVPALVSIIANSSTKLVQKQSLMLVTKCELQKLTCLFDFADFYRRSFWNNCHSYCKPSNIQSHWCREGRNQRKISWKRTLFDKKQSRFWKYEQKWIYCRFDIDSIKWLLLTQHSGQF